YKNKLLKFINYDSNRYFTLYSLSAEGFNHYLNELGFSNLFYERLIWAFEEFRTIQLTTGYLIKKSKVNFTMRQFLYDFVSEKRIVSLEEIIDDIKHGYGIILDAWKIIYLLRQTDVFYSEELHKFYIDKEDYFEEVYE